MFRAAHVRIQQVCQIGSIIFTAVGILFLALPVLAQISPIDFQTFTGAGFQPGNGGGTLDSNLWAVAGFDSPPGSCIFGATCTTGDFARGQTASPVTTGGIYSFNTGGGNFVLGVQPTDPDFTMGSFTLRVTNNTGSTVADVYAAYEIWFRNDQERANSFNFSYSLDNITYTPVPALNFTSPGPSDALGWQMTPRTTLITGVNVVNGADIYLRWTGSDVLPPGSRDEFGLDNVEVRVNGPTAVTLKSFNFEPSHPSTWLVVAGVLLLSLGSLSLWWERRARYT